VNGASSDLRWCIFGADFGDSEGAAIVIPIPSGCRVWIATGHTDTRRGMQGLAFRIQEQLKRNPHASDLYILRRRRGDLVKVLWHDGLGLSLYAKRLDRGKLIWPLATEGVVSILAAQMAYMLERIDWRNPQMTWRSRSTGSERPVVRDIRKTWGHLHFRVPRFAENMIAFVSRLCPRMSPR
jgi:transposase